MMFVLAITLSGCGNSASTTKTAKTESTEKSSDNIEVEKELFDVTMTVPADFVGETTQEKLDQTAKENGYKSITLNDDGSATYVMTKSQHKALMKETAASINKSLSEMVGSEDYPNFTDIKTNSDFTQFTVTTKSTELNIDESIAVMGFYLYGGMYAAFNGTQVDNIHVDFVNADTGEIINSSDSSDLQNAK